MKDATQPGASGTPHYEVKSVQPVMVGSDMQARLFILAPGDTIPWHCHSRTSDHYFVLEGELTVHTRESGEARTLSAGGDYKIMPGTAHLITNRSAVDCRFLLLQGVGTVDWVRASV